MQFGAIIVNYNIKISDSLTYNTIKNKFNGEILCVDNSTKPEIIAFNTNYCHMHNINYITKHDNLGLSVAYNIGINFFKNKNIDYIITLDHDTNISAEYLDLLNNFIFKNKTIYAPLVYNQNHQLTSPSYHCDNYIVDFLKQKKYASLQRLERIIPNKHIYAINSGLIIPMDFFTLYNYNEQLFIDCVDHDICKNIYLHNYSIELFPASIQQNYSTNEINNKSINENESRILLRLKDCQTYDSKNYVINKFVIIILYFLRSKNIKYLKYLFK